MGLAEEVDFAAAPRVLGPLELGDPGAWTFAAMSRCGSVSLDGFAGQWRADAEGWANASVADGRLRWGSEPRSELCAVHAVERAPDTLLVIALWHHDLDDPGDASLTYVSLQRRGDTLRVCRDDDRDRLDGGLEDDGRCVELSRATP